MAVLVLRGSLLVLAIEEEHEGSNRGGTKDGRVEGLGVWLVLVRWGVDVEPAVLGDVEGITPPLGTPTTDLALGGDPGEPPAAALLASVDGARTPLVLVHAWEAPWMALGELRRGLSAQSFHCHHLMHPHEQSLGQIL